MTRIDVELLSLGEIHDLGAFEPTIHQWVEQAVPQEATFDYDPRYFHDHVWHRAKHHPGKILVLHGKTGIKGDLNLGPDAAWNSEDDITAIVVEGDLSIDGDLFNLNTHEGCLLFVTGNLQARNILNGGSPIIVLGDVLASGIIVGHHYMGVIRAGGRIAAQTVMGVDQELYALNGIISLTFSWDEMVYCWEERLWDEILVPDVIEHDMPVNHRIFEYIKEGRSIFR